MAGYCGKTYSGEELATEEKDILTRRWLLESCSVGTKVVLGY